MIVIEKFAGLATNASPYSIPPGAAVTQVNVQILSPGQLTVREGLATVSWTTHTGSTEPIVRAINYQHSTFPQAVYQNSAGAVYVAKVPS
jgi:hypothetical protein